MDQPDPVALHGGSMGGLRQFNAKESADKAVHELYEKVWPKGGKMLVTDYIDLATMNGLISKKQ